ncbi:MAG TPA: hypothetical protein VK638_08440, partial [Edaphobacter sp.]|nr:hypothetical protein [Edaphobacter sp.]
MKHTIAAALTIAVMQMTGPTLGSASAQAAAPAQAAFVNTLMPQPAHLNATGATLPWTTAVTVGVPHFRNQRLEDA